MPRSRTTILLCGGLICWVIAAPRAASAEPQCPGGCDQSPVFYPNRIDVEWRPSVVNAVPGQVIALGLYVVPDAPDASEEISALQVILNWDSTKLGILAHQNNNPNDPDLYNWLFAGFANDVSLDNVNAGVTVPPLGVPNNDGDAYLEALAQFPPPLGEGSAVAPPGGLLVTTFRFQALAETLSTEIVIPDYMGDFTCSFVAWGSASCDLADALGTARVRVTAQPYLPGDGDSDGDVDADDYTQFLDCEASDGVDGDCWIFDFDLDLDVDFHDFAGFQIAFGS